VFVTDDGPRPILISATTSGSRFRLLFEAIGDQTPALPAHNAEGHRWTGFVLALDPRVLFTNAKRRKHLGERTRRLVATALLRETMTVPYPRPRPRLIKSRPGESKSLNLLKGYRGR
jgi:hypothetical protein